jgi:glycosyltransferase involved in cell wall biosynthesis
MSTQPISIVYFTNVRVRGGAEDHILTLLSGLDRNLFRPLLVCPAELARKLQPDIAPDVEVLPLRLESPAQVRAAWQFARILRHRRVGILHAHLFRSSLVASPIGWLCRVPVIVETPHLRESWRNGWFKGSFFVDRLVGRCVRRYVAVSQANGRYLVEKKGLPASKITVIVPGSDLRRFNPKVQASPQKRESLGFGPADPVLLVAARLEVQKGHRVLLEAMPYVRTQFPRVRLVCLSEGSLRPELERRSEELGLRDTVRFVGFQPDVSEWLALADLSVLPSFFEGLPAGAIESLAAARPVVATAVDGTPEVVLDGKTGLLVPPGDPESLAGAICRLLGDPALRAALGEAGRRWVVENFSRERLIERTQALYLEAWNRYAVRERPAHAVSVPAPSRE